MGSSDDDAGVSPQAAGDVSDSGGGQGADEQHVHTHRKDAGRDGILEHVSRKARVLAEHNFVPATAAGLGFEVLEHVAGGAAELEGGLGGDGFDVSGATNTVRTKDFFRGGHLEEVRV